MCIRNIVINLSEKPADARGRRARVNIAEIGTCFNAIFARPSPRRSRDCNAKHSNYSAVLHLHMVLLRRQKNWQELLHSQVLRSCVYTETQSPSWSGTLWKTGLLPYSQKPNSRFYHEPVASSPQAHATYFLNIHFNITLKSMHNLPK